jgi:hypothetical protein
MSADVGAGAFFTLLGVLIGAFISLWPTILIQQLQDSEAVRKMLRLLHFEFGRIINHCNQRIAFLDGRLQALTALLSAGEGAETTLRLEFSVHNYLPSNAWAAVGQSPLFVDAISETLANALADAYGTVNLANRLIDEQSAFVGAYDFRDLQKVRNLQSFVESHKEMLVEAVPNFELRRKMIEDATSQQDKRVARLRYIIGFIVGIGVVALVTILLAFSRFVDWEKVIRALSL